MRSVLVLTALVYAERHFIEPCLTGARLNALVYTVLVYTVLVYYIDAEWNVNYIVLPSFHQTPEFFL